MIQYYSTNTTQANNTVILKFAFKNERIDIKYTRLYLLIIKAVKQTSNNSRTISRLDVIFEISFIYSIGKYNTPTLFNPI